MRGRIIKGIGGFYYVHTSHGIYTCKAKGAFRKDNIKPLVGDYVELEALAGEDMTGSITSILPRENSLIRPNVANVDQALIIFALRAPEPNFVTLDKMILQYMVQNIPVILCFNKEDLVDDKYVSDIVRDYSNSGCRIFVTSANTLNGVTGLKEALANKTTTVAGPSGAGKSSLVNAITKCEVMETGDISEKLARGKHTTRHSEIIPIDNNTFIMDTPGFSSFDLYDVESDSLSDYYDEFEKFGVCRFMPCSHTHEPGCGIKQAVENGDISKRRYENYVYIFEELKKVRRY